MEKRSFELPVFSSYRVIPGVTAEEIAAIEAVRERVGGFVYGMTLSTEMFIGIDGEIGGFTVHFCDWLTKLFGIPFEPRLYTWMDMIDGLENGSVDFTHELTPNDERRQTYFMTDAIVQRTINYIRIEGSEPLPEIAQTRLPRYALIRGTTTIGDVMYHAAGTFEPVYVNSYRDAYELMKTGEIDALLAENVAQAVFDAMGDVTVKNFFPLLYTPVSLSARRAELEPFISVVQKALSSGGYRYLSDMYRKGAGEYRKHTLFTRFSQEELDFIRDNPVIPFAAEHDNYPVSFYNTRENEWQGISFGILREVEALTGLKFEVAHGKDTEWSELFRMLESGDALIVSELIRTPEREGRFLWSETPFFTDRSVLISKTEFRDIDMSEVYSVRVGLTAGVAHTYLFREWFPNHKNTIEYGTVYAALDALARGEVDMVMNQSNILLQLTHYQELPYYKANIVFDNPFESTFGFNADAGVLLSIVEKALAFVNVEAVSEQWLRKTYDYRVKLAQARIPWIISTAVVLGMLLVILTVIYVRDKKRSKAIIEGIRKREIAEASNKAKNRFLATVSQEIRTPMNSIMGFAELALNAADGVAAPQVKEYLAKITENTKSLLYTVNDILDISKTESGKMELDDAQFDILKKPRFGGALILVCDDDAMNREVMREHLANVGIRTVAAEDGKAAVEAVRERAQKGEKPFDLIFMDMFMPVMGGIEAVSAIAALRTGTPIVPVTVCVKADELENYRKHGMSDYLGKPYTSQELWRVLLKYLTPVSSSAADSDERARVDDELRKKMQVNFAKNGQSLYDGIAEAVNKGDVESAYRLAHTLKGSAGQIGKAGLQSVAADIEKLLTEGTALVSEGKMNLLEAELSRVLEELQPMFDECATTACARIWGGGGGSGMSGGGWRFWKKWSLCFRA
ncbi:MAG: transporter substrate-binding domain-containing protein [Chitinispirillales bacterium]|nr:transporter substrate-binding domain-containing protein [Chitinispirillales bacterium]